MPAGYSKNPLPKKLGIKPGYRVSVLNEPTGFRSLLVDLPVDVAFQRKLEGDVDMVIAFYTDHASLQRDLEKLGQTIFPNQALWLAWPKKSSGVGTDLTGDVVRATVLQTKMVDIKICAISDVFSGLKVVWRKQHR